MKAIRLLMVLPSSALTGGPRVLLNLVGHLDREKYVPIVLLFEDGPMVTELEKIKIPYHICDPNSALKLERFKESSLFGKISTMRSCALLAFRVSMYIREWDIDLIWARNFKSVALVGPASRMLQIPLIWDIGLERPGHGLFKLLHAVGLVLSTQVVTEADSQHGQVFGARCSRKFSRKIRTINPGISEERIEDIGRSKKSSQHNLLHGCAELNVLQVGTLCPRKNQLLSVKAIQRLRDRPVSLHLVGGSEDESYEAAMRACISEFKLDDKVFLYGWSDNIPSFLAAADLFLMTSLNEGIPYAVHEAMHASLPVIVSDAGGMPDAVVPSHTGIVTETGNLDQLVNAITYFLENPRELDAMGQEGKKRAENEFSAARWHENYVRLFEGLNANDARTRWWFA